MDTGNSDHGGPNGSGDREGQSMDDILASIQRIITEDPSGLGTARRPAGPPTAAPPSVLEQSADDESADDVLELTSPITPPPAAAPAAQATAPAMPPAPPRVERAPDWPALLAGPVPVPAPAALPFAGPAGENAPAPRPAPDPAVKASGGDPLLSDRSTRASREALNALSSLLVAPPSGSAGTLEDLVRDMLRPMLKDWLDDRLPALVETMVAREIARITRPGG